MFLKYKFLTNLVRIMMEQIYQTTYKRIAEGIIRLGMIIEPSGKVMPLGFDGSVLYHLLTYYYGESGILYKDDMDCTVHISSKQEEADREKFERVLSQAGNNKVYGLDLRTKTGTLGKVLKQMVEEYREKTNSKVDFLYTVIFDKYKNADLRAFEEELLDRERFYWLPRKEDLEKLFWQENGIWRYKISHEFLAEVPNVKKIKELM